MLYAYQNYPKRWYRGPVILHLRREFEPATPEEKEIGRRLLHEYMVEQDQILANRILKKYE